MPSTAGESQTGQIAAVLEQTKENMVESIQKVINRGESIENIAETSEGLRDTSLSFRQSANQLKRQAQCERIKLYVCIALVFAGFSIAIAMYVCGPKFDQC